MLRKSDFDSRKWTGWKCGDGCQQHFWGGASDAGQAVVFADPKPLIAPVFAALRQRQGVADGFILRASFGHHGLIEHGEFEHRPIIEGHKKAA